jgi:hypothetical protein
VCAPAIESKNDLSKRLTARALPQRYRALRCQGLAEHPFMRKGRQTNRGIIQQLGTSLSSRHLAVAPTTFMKH